MSSAAVVIQVDNGETGKRVDWRVLRHVLGHLMNEAWRKGRHPIVIPDARRHELGRTILHLILSSPVCLQYSQLSTSIVNSRLSTLVNMSSQSDNVAFKPQPGKGRHTYHMHMTSVTEPRA